MQTQTQTPNQKLDELIRQFHSRSVNQSGALNFTLGALVVRLNKQNEVTASDLAEVLESALRFSRIR